MGLKPRKPKCTCPDLCKAHRDLAALDTADLILWLVDAKKFLYTPRPKSWITPENKAKFTRIREQALAAIAEINRRVPR